MKVIKQSNSVVAEAVTLLKKGKVIIVPTDTVYGFLADASNKKAVDRIFKIKQRPKTKPLSLFVKNITVAKEIAIVDEKQLKQLKKYWPGKYTFILQRKMYGAGPRTRLFGVKQDTVGIRIPKHPFLTKILKVVDRPLVQTSVNISDNPPLNSLEDIWLAFGKSKLIDIMIDGGDIARGKASRVIDLSQKNINILRK